MKILIVKTSSLGDIVQSFPALEYLRQSFPHARIDWVVENSFSGLLTSHPYVDRVIKVNTKAWRRISTQNLRDLKSFFEQLREEEYDVLFDLQGNLKSSAITFLARAKKKVGFGWNTVHEKPNYFFTHHHVNPPDHLNMYEHNLYLVKNFYNDDLPFESKGISLRLDSEEQKTLHDYLQNPLMNTLPKVLVSPGTAWKNKKATREAMEEFLKLLQNHLQCVFLFIWGTNEEQEDVNRLAKQFPNRAIIVERLSLPLLQNLMSHMDLVISMDSMPLHLAGTTSVKTFSLFGPTMMNKFKPSGVQHSGIQGECPYNRKFKKQCPVLRNCPTGLCIRGLTGKQLFASYLHWDKSYTNLALTKQIKV